MTRSSLVSCAIPRFEQSGSGPLSPGLSLLGSGDFDDPATPRLKLARPRFEATRSPDPEREEWSGWQDLLSDAGAPSDAPAEAALRFRTARGYGTVSSALIALPAAPSPERPNRFRFAAWLPEPEPWRDIMPR